MPFDNGGSQYFEQKLPCLGLLLTAMEVRYLRRVVFVPLLCGDPTGDELALASILKMEVLSNPMETVVP
ncbi:MAG: hypothetical protein G01um101456_646 [Parcubacteria group bacterium Gr01-1014_56]|nr:MAG: hypothetical protein G01um101456_646 [Parcubacteria group bacterium Gr01-1014_56]